MATMTVAERRSIIEQRALLNGEIEFSPLATEFGVSEMTIRRDIDHLEAQGVLRRVPKGAISVHARAYEPPYKARALAAAREKQSIAVEIANLIRPRETLILDSGSSALAVAREIRGKGLNLTILTPSILAALELVEEPGAKIILTGGTFRAGELSLIGPDAQETFSRYNCDTFVMGVAGLDGKKGASDYHEGEAAVKRAALESVDRVIVSADASKLGHVHLSSVAPLRVLDVIVSDGAKGDPTLSAAASEGVQVITVPGLQRGAETGVGTTIAPEGRR